MSPLTFQLNEQDSVEKFTSRPQRIEQNQPGRDENDTRLRIDVHPEFRFQQLEGMAGSFSEIGAEALLSLPEAKRAQVADDLFGANGVPGLAWGRLPIGASDFALSAYSFSEVADDFEQEHFSIERDRGCLMEFIRLAKERNPDFQIHASPWSPPAWMKTNGAMDGNDKAEGKLRAEPEVRRAYARYLRKFVEAYAAEGIPIARLAIQNEPDSEAPFPGCLMMPEDMIDFVVNYLAPEFQQADCEAEIWAGTFRTLTGLQAHECMRNEAFRASVTGCAFQYSMHKYIAQFHHQFPDCPILHSESVCYGGKNSGAQAISLLEDVIGYFEAGAKLYTYWNMILNETQTSSWGWKQNSLVTIDRNTGDVACLPDMEVMRLLARTVVPGSTLLQSYCFHAPVLAVEKPSGKVGVIFYNRREARPVTVTVAGQSYDFEIPGHAFVSLEVG